MTRWIRPFVFPALLLSALELWARTVGAQSDAIAPPSHALRALGGALTDGSLLGATGFTLGSAALGLLIGGSLALIPLAMLVFGFGLRMEVSVVAFACLWPVGLLTQAAVQQVEPRLLEVASALQMSAWQRFTWIVGPAIVPRLFVALRLGVAIALVVAVTVEIAANPNGMGYAMMIAQQSLDPALMLAWLFWIGVVGSVVNAGAEWLQRKVARRMGEVTA